VLKIDRYRLKELFPDSDFEGWEIPSVLANIALQDPSLTSIKEDTSSWPTLPSTFPAEARFNQVANSVALKKMLAPVVNEADPSSRWDQVVTTSWGNWRVDYMNDELYAKILHAPTTAVLTTHLRVNIYRHLWKFVTFSGGGRVDDPNYHLIIITLPQDQPIDFVVDDTRRFAPTISNTRMLRRITSEALSMGIYVMLARTPAQVAAILANPSKIDDPGWDWTGHEWDENPDD
jgi:hypothetical protein